MAKSGTQKKVSKKGNLDAKIVRKMGLSAERIQTHANRIRAALAGELETSIPVDEACTVENGGIVSWDVLSEWLTDVAERRGEDVFFASHMHWVKNHLVTMVPAAGAASRFLGELRKFTDEVEQKVEGLAAGISKKQNRALPGAEKFHEKTAGIVMKPAIAELAEKVEEQQFIDVVREYIRIGVLLGVFHDVEFTGEASKKKRAAKIDTSETDWRCHWIDNLGDEEEFDDHDDHGHHHFHDEDDQKACGDGGCEDCDCESGCGTGCGTGCCAEEGSEPVSALKVYAAAKAILNLYGGEPKALVPTTVEGDSFLRLKMIEQISLQRSAGNVLVVPAGQKKKIQKIVSEEEKFLTQNYRNVFSLQGTPCAPKWLTAGVHSMGEWSVMEQGNDLSTIRFGMDAKPVVEKGGYSMVAAGHGELVHLFAKIAAEFPKAECLHVRNIDNVVGANPDVAANLSGLGDAFRLIRDTVEFLRAEVSAHLKSSRNKKDVRISNPDVCLALDMISVLIPNDVAQASLPQCFSSEGDFIGVPAESVFQILAALFHWQAQPAQVQGKALWQEISQKLALPVSVFGVVKKEDNDVGGGPVFIRLPSGEQAKLCMEMPHANASDSQKYFAAGGKCTHFNPVLTFFELKTHGIAPGGGKAKSKNVDFRRLFDDRFWMLARKEHQGKSVCYHETVLYELIGNSATTNLVFVEVPRDLFVPHKTIFESLGRSRESYGFAEILGNNNGNGS